MTEPKSTAEAAFELFDTAQAAKNMAAAYRAQAAAETDPELRDKALKNAEGAEKVASIILNPELLDAIARAATNDA